MSDVVIVAIPAEDDPVWKVSSEKVPHMTLLYMEGPFDDEEEVLKFVEHTVSTSLCRFGMSVDRRGTLGEDDADVLFFDKRMCGKELLDFRGYLLTNTDIYTAYKKAEQYPMWTPHLTLGYPETPANPNPNEYGIHWVNFDRVAVWTSDYAGPEFTLKANSSMEIDVPGYWSESDGDFGEYLEHFGVRGMKWGNRLSDEELIEHGLVSFFKTATGATRKVVRDARGQFASTAGSVGGAISDSYLMTLRRLFPGSFAYKEWVYSDHTEKFDLSPENDREKYVSVRKISAVNSEKGGQDVIREIRTDSRGRKSYKTTVDGKEVKPFINFDNQRKAIEKDLKILEQHPTFTNKAKLDTSQVVDPMNESSTDKKLARVKTTKNVAKDVLITDKIQPKGSLRKSVDKYYKEHPSKRRKTTFGHDEFQNESLDDVLMHFGVRGMRWGVRRPTDPSTGLAKGTVAGAIKSGQHPHTDVLLTKGKKGQVSEDHAELARNINKKVENLSTKEIKQITARIKAVNEFKAVTDAQKAAKANLGVRLAKWALTQVAEGAKQQGQNYIRSQTGSVIDNLLPKVKKREDTTSTSKTSNAKTSPKRKKVKSEFIQPDSKTSRDQAVKQLALEIGTLSTKEE